METRVANTKDKQAVKELWENSFHYSRSFLDWYFDKAFIPENTILTFDGARAVSSMTIVPQTLSVSGKQVRAAYITGLALLPEYRDGENLKQQLTETVVSTAQKDYLLSVIIPSDYRFYERYGWRTAYSYKQYDIKPSDLPEYRVRGHFERAKADDGTIKALSEIYGEFTKGKNAYVLRKEEDWKLILEDLFVNFGGQCLILKDNEENPAGYILSIIRDRKMGIYEMAYKDRASYESLMGFIRRHELSVDSVTMKAPADDLSYLDFCDNRLAVHFCPFAMARISDAKKALEAVSAEPARSFNLQIIDRLVEANNKTFRLAADGIFEVDEAPDAVTDIGALTQLFLGYISVEEACRMNLISGDAEGLKMFFDKKSNYINMLIL